MKKLLLLVSVLLTVNLFALDLYVGPSVSYGNEWNTKVTPATHTKYKEKVYGVNLELTQAIPFVELGIGVSYEKDYKMGTESYDAMPVYGLAKVNLFPIGVKPYLVAKYGKVMFENAKNVTLKDGDFYSAGLGITLLKKLQLEGAYSLSKGKKNGEDLKTTAATVTLRYNIY